MPKRVALGLFDSSYSKAHPWQNLLLVLNVFPTMRFFASESICSVQVNHTHACPFLTQAKRLTKAIGPK